LKDQDGSENYSRCAKSILQVGPAGARLQGAVTVPIGLLLEIVPERSPYAESASATLPVRVLYEGPPLAGALIKLTRLEDDGHAVRDPPHGPLGRAIFRMPSTGTWLLNVVSTKIQPTSAETDYETTFSSLSFAFSSPRLR
jgi:uncharacterized GH25 family protein